MNLLRPLAAFAILFAASCEQKSIVIRNDAETDAPAPPPTATASLPEKVSFNEHIQPILSEYCYPSREKFCVKRDRTNTPLQALAMMNEPQFVEAGKMLAAKALGAYQTFDERLDLMTLRLIGRKMDATERGVVKATLDAATAYYTGKPQEAGVALTTGEAKPPETIPAVELASWALVAGQLLNLDETLTR